MRFGLVAAFVALTGLASAPVLAADSTPAENAAFLRANKGREGVVVLPSGLQYRVLKSGTGRTPKATDTVRVIYSGHTIDGTVFDQTGPGQMATFVVGQLIKGWVEALTRMKEGDRWELVIPADLAYGERGAPGAIGPNQALVFEMELMSVQ